MQIDIPAQSGQVLAPLSQVARIEEETAPSKIRRRDLMRKIRISANAQGRSLGEVIADIHRGGSEPASWISDRLHGRI